MNLQTFDYNTTKVRMEVIDGKPWFCAKDVCDILQHTNNRKALSDFCEASGVTKRYVRSGGQRRQLSFIDEANLYRLVLRSKLPNAKQFETWVVGTVLPSIRQTGKYDNQPELTREQQVAKALLLAQEIIVEKDERIHELEGEIEVNAPKVEFYEAVAQSDDCISIGEAAKMLNVDDIGQNKLFAILRECGVLMKGNLPKQEYINRGYFRVIEQYYEAKGKTRIGKKTLVTQKGLDWIRRLLKKPEAISE